jgi:hypothetical protein
MQAEGLFHRGNPRAITSHSQGRTATGKLGEGGAAGWSEVRWGELDAEESQTTE